jgi:hypothetical protein
VRRGSVAAHGDVPLLGNVRGMKIMRTAAMLGMAKKLYDESRKPENQARIKSAVEKVKARKSGGSKGHKR